jgi:Flp pilus assembly pilin Flp
MRWRIKFLTRYSRNIHAATATEYGLIACGIALAIVSVVFLFGDGLEQLFGRMPDALEAAQGEIETSR